MTTPASDENGTGAADTRKPALRRIARWIVRPAGTGYGVYGDDRLLRTPAGHDLVAPSQGLAEAIAAEFRAQAGAKSPDVTAMPNLRLAATVLDQVAAERDATVDAIVAYGETELLCYRAEHPADLVERQHAVWQPLLDWAAVRFKAALGNTAGIMPHRQPAASLTALRAAVADYDDFLLGALAFAVQTSGSLVIGLAMLDGRLDAAGAFDVAELDESYQIEQWGEDTEATKRRATRRKDLEDVTAFITLVRS